MGLIWALCHKKDIRQNVYFISSLPNIIEVALVYFDMTEMRLKR